MFILYVTLFRRKKIRGKKFHGFCGSLSYHKSFSVNVAIKIGSVIGESGKFSGNEKEDINPRLQNKIINISELYNRGISCM